MQNIKCININSDDFLALNNHSIDKMVNLEMYLNWLMNNGWNIISCSIIQQGHLLYCTLWYYIIIKGESVVNPREYFYKGRK
jgi:hypothetical protein